MSMRFEMSVIRFTSKTVSYAEVLTSIYICYSQGIGFNTPLSIFCILYTRASSVVVPLLLRSVVRLCLVTTSVSGNT